MDTDPSGFNDPQITDRRLALEGDCKLFYESLRSSQTESRMAKDDHSPIALGGIVDELREVFVGRDETAIFTMSCLDQVVVVCAFESFICGGRDIVSRGLQRAGPREGEVLVELEEH